MKLFNRLRKKPKITFRVFEGPEILQRFLLDCRISEVQQLGTLLGLPPMGSDQAAAEQAASDIRIARVAPAVPLIGILTSSLTASIFEYISTMTGYEFDEDDANAFNDLFYRVALANSIGTVTTLEDLGLIHYPNTLEAK